jgi:hypothetical protein
MPKKFIYINEFNQKTEESVFIVSEFVSTGPQAGLPVITEAGTGLISSSLLPSTGTVESATKLKITRIAQEVIATGDVVRAFSSTHVVPATADSTKATAMVLGIATNSAAVTESVDIILLGVATETAFSIFALNDPLFLDTNGGITNIKRTAGYHVDIGKSLGGNDILFQPSTPTKIA